MPIIGYSTKGATLATPVQFKYVVDNNAQATEDGIVLTLNAWIGANQTCKLGLYDSASNGNLIVDGGEVTADATGLASVNVSSQDIPIVTGTSYYPAFSMADSSGDGIYYTFSLAGSNGSPYSSADYPNEFSDPFGTTTPNSNVTVSAWMEYGTGSNLTITEKPDNFQGVLNASDEFPISISGGYTITPTTLQGQVRNRSTDAIVLAWTNLTNITISGGNYSGDIPGIPGTDALLYYEVRDSAVPDDIVESTKDFSGAYHFPCGGQSNMEYMFVFGTGTPDALTYKIDDATGTLKTMTGEGAITLANTLHTLLSRPIVLYDFGVGSAALIQANNLGPGWWLNPSAVPYAAMESAVDAYTGGLMHGFLWLQGETEATKAESAIDYQTNEALFFTQIDTDFTNALGGTIPKISCLLNRWLDSGVTDQEWVNVDTGKIANHKADANAHYVSGIELSMADFYHLDATGQGTLALRYAQKIADILGFVSYSNHPEVDSYEIIDTTTTDFNLVLSSGATDFTPTTGIDCFRVLLDGAWTAVTGARVDATTVRATHTAGTVTDAACLYGRDPAISGIIKDNSALALPIIQNYTIAEYIATQEIVLDSNWPTGAEIVINGVTYTEDSTIELEAGSYSAVPNTLTGYTNDGAQNFTVIIGTPQTVTINYTIIEYEITVSAGANGTIAPTTLNVEYGASQTFSMTVDAGYHISDVLVDSISQGAITSYEFTNVTETHTISATFAEDVAETETVSISSNWPTGAEITVNSITYTSNTDIQLTEGSYTATPNTIVGYTASPQNFTVVIGTPQTITITYTSTGESFMVIEDGTIVTGANSFVTRSEYIAYALTLGTTIPNTTATDVELISATSFMESKRQSYKGELVDRDQYLSFPRYDVVIEGFYWTGEEIPRQVKLCQMAIALDINAGNDPYNPPIIRTRKSEEIDGAVKVAYFGRDQDVKLSRNSKWSALLNSLLKNSGLGIAMVKV